MHGDVTARCRLAPVLLSALGSGTDVPEPCLVRLTSCLLLRVGCMQISSPEEQAALWTCSPSQVPQVGPYHAPDNTPDETDR